MKSRNNVTEFVRSTNISNGYPAELDLFGLKPGSLFEPNEPKKRDSYVQLHEMAGLPLRALSFITQLAILEDLLGLVQRGDLNGIGPKVT